MQLVNYKPQTPPTPLLNKIKQLFLIQKPRQFKIVKPSINYLQPSSSLTQINSQKEQRRIKPQLSDTIKAKIIKKINYNRPNIEKQKVLQKSYNNYLLNFLHSSNLQSIKKKQQPALSLLQFKEDGDYPDQKKDHPHYSNVIKLTQIPKQVEVKIIPKPMKKVNKQIFTIEQNSVMKVNTVKKFLKMVFRIGNQEFFPISEKLGISQRTAKLLFDMLDNYFNIQKIINNAKPEVKAKNLRKILKYISSSFLKYKTRDQTTSSIYIPFEEQYINLKQIRTCFSNKIQSSSDQSSISSSEKNHDQ